MEQARPLIRLMALAMGCAAMSCGESSTPSNKSTDESTETDAGATEPTADAAEPTSGSDASSSEDTTGTDAATEADAGSTSDAATQTDAAAVMTEDADPGPAPVPPDATGAVFTDDFESGASKWNITQGTCSVAAEATNILTCLNGGNEARAVGGDPTWTDLTVSANVKIRQMDDGRRIYLAGRFIDSNNWYGAAFYNAGTRRVQIRKKVAGASSDIAEATFPFEFDTWYTLTLKISGSTLTLSVDGVEQAQGTDTDFTSGGVALLVDRSEVSWDNVVVTIP